MLGRTATGIQHGGSCSAAVVADAVAPEAHLSDTAPLTIGAPIAAVPRVVTVGVVLPALFVPELLPPPPHAASAAHRDAPSANPAILSLILFLFTVWFLFRWLMKKGDRKYNGIQLRKFNVTP